MRIYTARGLGSPDGPSSYRHSNSSSRLNSPANELPRIGLEKAHKSLSFSEFSRVVTIPPRHECLAADMDLWWTPLDYHTFKQMRAQESQAGIDLVSFNFQKTQAKDDLVDLRILVISNENVLSSSITCHLAAALSSYEVELNEKAKRDPDCPVHTDPRYQRVRSSVTQVAHNSKEYALAVQGASSRLLYNVIVFDSGRRTNPKEETDRAWLEKYAPLDDLEREHMQASSFALSSCYSYMVNTEQGGTVPASANLSPLLLSDSYDASEVPSDENYLLRKIIKAGTALCYVCERPSLAGGCSCRSSESLRVIPVPQVDSSAVPPISVSPCQCWRRPPARRHSAPPLVSPLPHYSLLRDHADVVVDPAGTGSTYRSLTEEAWLQLFRVTAARTAPPCPCFAGKTASEPVTPSTTPTRVGEDPSESLLSRSLRGQGR